MRADHAPFAIREPGSTPRCSACGAGMTGLVHLEHNDQGEFFIYCSQACVRGRKREFEEDRYVTSISNTAIAHLLAYRVRGKHKSPSDPEDYPPVTTELVLELEQDLFRKVRNARWIGSSLRGSQMWDGSWMIIIRDQMLVDLWIPDKEQRRYLRKGEPVPTSTSAPHALVVAPMSIRGQIALVREQIRQNNRPSKPSSTT